MKLKQDMANGIFKLRMIEEMGKYFDTDPNYPIIKKSNTDANIEKEKYIIFNIENNYYGISKDVFKNRFFNMSGFEIIPGSSDKDYYIENQRFIGNVSNKLSNLCMYIDGMDRILKEENKIEKLKLFRDIVKDSGKKSEVDQKRSKINNFLKVYDSNSNNNVLSYFTLQIDELVAYVNEKAESNKEKLCAKKDSIKKQYFNLKPLISEITDFGKVYGMIENDLNKARDFFNENGIEIEDGGSDDKFSKQKRKARQFITNNEIQLQDMEENKRKKIEEKIRIGLSLNLYNQKIAPLEEKRNQINENIKQEYDEVRGEIINNFEIRSAGNQQNNNNHSEITEDDELKNLLGAISSIENIEAKSKMKSNISK